MERREIYRKIKEYNLGEEIEKRFDRNYTNVSSLKLACLIERYEKEHVDNAERAASIQTSACHDGVRGLGGASVKEDITVKDGWLQDLVDKLKSRGMSRDVEELKHAKDCPRTGDTKMERLLEVLKRHYILNVTEIDYILKGE